METINQVQLQEKWAPVLDSQDAGKIADAHKRNVTAVVLENQEKAFQEERAQAEGLHEAAAANMSNGSGVSNWDPVLISLVRRATPAMLAFDLVGVQPMTGPTGLIFAMKSRYSTQGGTEALFNEADTAFSGAASGSTTASDDPFAGDTDTPAPEAEEQKPTVIETIDEAPDVEPEPTMTEPVCGPGTVLKNGVCVAEQQKKGGGCLIATAAFGSEMAPQVQFLREIRDNTVLQTESGSAFMTGFNQFYYSFSPVIADYERENIAFKETVKIAITPMLTSLAILNYVDIDSEEEMLGYGIGIILLNIGMYFVAPAVVIFKIRNRK